MNIDMELVMQTVSLMGKGMAAIFVVILVIFAVVELLLRTTGREQTGK